MKKTSILLFLILVLLFGVGNASALTFTLDSYNVALNTAEPGLTLYWKKILTTPASHDFSVGEQLTVDLFSVGTAETWSNLDDKVHKDISVAFNFSAPLVSGNVSGESWGNAIVIASWGKVEWDDPISFVFGNGGLFTIDLGNALFCTPGCDIVTAKFKYVRAPTPVHEPTTMLLLGFGLIGLAAFGGKRFITKA